MKASIAQWAASPASLRREPTNAEVAGGYACGDLDINLFNELGYRLTQATAEIDYCIRQSGQTPNASNLTQLWAALQSLIDDIDFPTPPETPAIALWHTGVAGGTTSAITSTLTPAITSYQDRLPVFITFPNGIASNATAALNGLSALQVQRNDGTPIQKDDVPPGSGALFNIAGSALRLAAFGRNEVQRITVNPTLWVRTDGNDNNDGLSNAAGGAFKTIAAALAKGTSQYSFASSALNIRLGQAGRYDSPGTIPRAAGTINIIGDASNQAGYIISGVGSTGQGVLQTPGALTLNGVTIENTGTGAHTLAATGMATVALFNSTLLTTGTTTGYHAFAPGGGITFAAGCIVQGNAAVALYGSAGGEVVVNPSTALAIAGTPTFSSATARADRGGRVTLLGGASVTGSANGPRYLAETYGIITTNGGGANAFPGSTAGSTNNAIYQ